MSDETTKTEDKTTEDSQKNDNKAKEKEENKDKKEVEKTEDKNEETQDPKEQEVKQAEEKEWKKEESKEEAPQNDEKSEDAQEVITLEDAKEEEPTEEEVSAEEERFPNLKPGQTVKVHQQIKELDVKGKGKTKERKRIQVFEGMILAKKSGKEHGATITVRKVSKGFGVEKIFPLNLPSIVKIEPVKQAEVKRAKLYYLRDYKKKLKEVVLDQSK